jgi:hypothetical protein
VSPECVYGNPDSENTVVLYGDSRAAQWFPALEKVATKWDWRLVSLTKSACPAADVPITLLGAKSEYDECYDWRRASLQRIADEDPELIVMSNWRTYGSTTAEWADGLDRAISSMPNGPPIVVLSSTPMTEEDTSVCLSGHLHDPAACATSRDDAIDQGNLRAEREVTTKDGGHYVDTTRWVCPRDPCQAIAFNFLIMRDTSHITATFAEFLSPRLEAVLRRLI